MRHDYRFPRTSREAFGDRAYSWQFPRDDVRDPPAFKWTLTILGLVFAGLEVAKAAGVM